MIASTIQAIFLANRELKLNEISVASSAKYLQYLKFELWP